jgi:hypothetical protein
MMTQRTYHVSNPIQFLSERWPLPANSLVFWSQGQAGGVLLFADVHYLVTPAPAGAVPQIAQIAFSLPLKAGDLITVVTFG